MCYIIRTRYSCTHLSPFHPPTHKCVSPTTEWPTHKDTVLQTCQDVCRRGVRCSDRLEDMKAVEKMKEGVCEECEDKAEGEEWVIVERSW